MQGGVRPTSPEDAPRVAALLAEASLHPNLEPGELHWKYWQVRPDWPGPRSFVLLRGDKLLAHAGIVPGIGVWQDERLRTIHLIDWAARPDAIGAGVSLMKHIGRTVDALLAIGGSAQTLAIVGQIGFRPIGVATTYVRTLHPLGILRSTSGARWRIVPRIARSALWSAMAPSAHSADSRAERIAPEAIGSLSAQFPGPTRQAGTLERSEPLLRYLLACPIVPIELYSWTGRGGKRGYFLLARAPGQARLVDCWACSEDPQDWRAMILCAVERARQDPDAAELVTWASDALQSSVLKQCGFHARGAAPIQLLARRGFRLPSATLRVQMVDNDAAYLHADGIELLA
jgi:hypothetical protein